jgi:tRNA pseudouridine synthase 10
MITNILEKLTNDISCCKRCLGRALDPTNNFDEIDYSLRIAEQLTEEILNKSVEQDQCDICMGVVEKSIATIDKIIHQLGKREFDSFLVGVKLHNILQKSESIWKGYGVVPRSLKVEIAREISLRIIDMTNKNYKTQLPDITILINAKNTPRFDLQIKSIFILGKYKKLKRGIPQTKWPCTHCKGKGCRECNNSGQQYPHTVEGLVSGPFSQMADTKITSFHGAGREDIDALMLGTGRPFVLELKKPYIRNIDIIRASEEVNKSDKVQISHIQLCEKDIIKKIKGEAPNSYKIYRAKVQLSNPANSELVAKLKELGEGEILLEQQTPIRVSHRRADMIRNKTIYKVEIISSDQNELELKIKAQGGAYIKEFISGDEGRTVPSVSSMLQNDAICTELDVLEVDDKELF